MMAGSGWPWAALPRGEGLSSFIQGAACATVKPISAGQLRHRAARLDRIGSYGKYGNSAANGTIVVFLALCV
jgi:hypothetical protein